MNDEPSGPTPALAGVAALAAAAGMMAAMVLGGPLYAAVLRVWGEVAALGLGALLSEIGLLIPVVVIVLVTGRGWKVTFGFRRPRLLPTIAALMATVGGGVVVDELTYLLVRLVPGLDQGNLVAVGEIIAGAGLAWALALLIPLALVPSVVEEMVCRGILMRGLLARFPSGWIPLLASAVYFGALHFDPIHISAAVLMGLLLGWIALRTGSLWPAVICHLVNNAISLLTPALGGPSLPDVLANGHSPVVLAMAAVGLILGLVGLSRSPAPVPPAPGPRSR